MGCIPLKVGPRKDPIQAPRVGGRTEVLMRLWSKGISFLSAVARDHHQFHVTWSSPTCQLASSRPAKERLYWQEGSYNLSELNRGSDTHHVCHIYWLEESHKARPQPTEGGYTKVCTPGSLGTFLEATSSAMGHQGGGCNSITVQDSLLQQTHSNTAASAG